jgi:peptide/nickel transport system ATP-binding protein
MSDNKALIRVVRLKKYFATRAGTLKAVDDLTFEIEAGRTLGVVGESGCGKSTLGRTVLGLLQATEGQVFFDGRDITHIPKGMLKSCRRDMQIIFQDPYSSLDPKMTVAQIIEEPLVIHKIGKSNRERRDQVLSLMELVGLDRRYVNTYPHELDGGRRQRIGIARALALNPRFIVCDEPVSALDVSIQAQILNLMMDLKDRIGLTYMFITHDLSVVKHISDTIMVLYMGKAVETASSDRLFQNPLHPYTQALFSAIPIPELSYKGKEIELLKGEVSSPINPPNACRFAPRCPKAVEICRQEEPTAIEVETGHFVACHLMQ